MQIKDPKFKEGQKVRDIEDGTIFTLININSYGFDYDEYWYDLECDGLTWSRPESKLELYIEKPKTVWDLKKDDTYYLIDIDGEVMNATWNNMYIDNDFRKIGNIFLTKEEAEFEVERRKIETEMLRLGGRRNFKFDGDNYGIYYCDGINVVYYCNTMYQGLIYFDTVKEAHDAIKEIGKNRIIKYVFGVES
ncbi:MAG: hypothetical protein SOS22_07305 [Absicoccus sp.]|uniref:hypothetical protein n=1 Tax=Absicoccus sp. TaxID=2718527 RepID=UPI002A760F42|nr:hypothetical protein [Absicoccus sp.]MDY3036011.1 hypothetical protein [Absicoccus sp.]